MVNEKKFYSFLSRTYFWKKFAFPVFLFFLIIVTAYSIVCWVGQGTIPSAWLLPEPFGKITSLLSLFLLTFTLISECLSGEGQLQIDSNRDTPRRIAKICDLIDSCEDNLVFVAGEFNYKVYDSKQVLKSIERLPDTVRIEAYIEASDNEECVRNDVGDYVISPDDKFKGIQFLAALRKRGASIGYVKPQTPHIIVVDKQNVRIEFDREKPNDSDVKKALIFYYSLDLADAMSDIADSRAC